MLGHAMIFKILILIQVTALAVLLRAPCIFRPNEPEMHKYSAILATTQPFRATCIDKIKTAMNPFTNFFGKLTGIMIRVLLRSDLIPIYKGKSVYDHGNSLRNKNHEVDDAMKKLEVQMESVLRYLMNCSIISCGIYSLPVVYTECLQKSLMN